MVIIFQAINLAYLPHYVNSVMELTPFLLLLLQ